MHASSAVGRMAVSAASPPLGRELALPRQPVFHSASVDRAVLWLVALFVMSYAFEGPLRYALIRLGAEVLLYSRDLVAIGVLVIVAACWLRGKRSLSWLMGAYGLFLCHLLIGLVTLPSSFQAFMGAKVLMPMLLGMALAPLLATRVDQLSKFSGFLFFSTVLGVVVNVWLEYPWVGASFSTVFAEVEVSRSWTAGGSLRIPGLTRASFIAAILSLISAVPLIAAPGAAWKRVLVWALAGLSVLITTTKGGISALLALGLLEGVARLIGTRTYALALSLLACVCLALPVAATQQQFGVADVPSWQVSFVERMRDMWPAAFDLLDPPWQILWGRGLGGIGTAQRFDEWSKLNAADNLMVYVLVTFGLIGLLYLCAYLARLFRFLSARPSSDHAAGMLRGWTTIWFSFGLTTNMLEEPLTSLALGVAFGFVFGAEQDS